MTAGLGARGSLLLGVFEGARFLVLIVSVAFAWEVRQAFWRPLQLVRGNVGKGEGLVGWTTCLALEGGSDGVLDEGSR